MTAPRFLGRPLIPLAVAAFLGSLTGWLAPSGMPAMGLAASALLAIVAIIFRKRPAAVPLLLAAAFCSYAVRAESSLPSRTDTLAAWVPRRDIVLEGRLRGLLQVQPQYRIWSGTLACERAVWHGRYYPVTGNVRFTLPGPAPEWNPGDRLRVRGQLHSVPMARNPGEFDAEGYYQRHGVVGMLKGQDPSDAVRVASAPAWSWGAIAAGLRRRWSKGILDCVPPARAGLVNALATGDRSGITPRESENLAAAGLAHLLAVSGMNVGIVFVTLTMVAGWIRLPRPAGLVLGLAGVSVLVLCTGAEAPVLRAGLMAAGMVLALIYGRSGDSASGLAFSALVILAWDPASCLDPGFQLSYAATAAILAALQIPVLDKFLGARLLLQSMLFSATAFVFTLPLTLYYFSSLALAGLLANLAAAPLLDVIVISGTVAGIGHWLWPALGRLAGQVAGWAAAGLQQVDSLALRLPWGRIFLYPPGIGWVVGFYLLLGLALIPSRLRAAALAGLGLWLLAYPCYQPVPPAADEVRLTFLSLAVGESTLVETREHCWLVDTGSELDFLRRVKPYLASRGINRLDGLWISHWDNDHAAGCEACLQYFHVTKLFTSGIHAAGHGEPLPQGCKTQVEVLTLGQARAWGTTQFQVFWPPLGEPSKTNENCLSVKLSQGDQSVLFTGDSPSEVERQWTRTACTILKAGHHGSRKSSSSEFLERALPELAVVMPGNSNPFGFPHPQAVERLGKSCGAVITTREHGAIRVTTQTGKPVKWEYWR